MPIMDVRYAAGSLDKASKADLAGRLTDVLVKMEGGANTPGGRDFAWVWFTAFTPDDVWVAGLPGGPDAAALFLVHIAIPEGYMNRAHKNEVHAWVASAIAAATGAAEADLRILTVIDEVTEGNWGSRGVPISLEFIAQTVGQPKDGPRLQWSNAFFAAKSRAMAEAAFPTDAGGLPPSLSHSG